MASDAAITAVRIPVWLWARLLSDLRRRGKGRGESGAFLLGREANNPARVTAYICYDDLDAGAYQGGAIAFHAAGYAALWKYCKEKRLFDHDGFRIIETGAIASYLDEVLPGPSFTPESSKDRARMRMAMSIVDSYGNGADRCRWISLVPRLHRRGG